MRLCDHERLARKRLLRAGVDSPALCARLLAARAADLDRTGYLLNDAMDLDPEREKLLNSMISRRAAGEPLAYILGAKEFYDHEFLVNSATLIPRPETEILVDAALDNFTSESISFVDIGCGCGCIGISLLGQRPAWRGSLLDNSAGALRTAEDNLKKFGVSANLLLGDIFHLPFGSASLDLIVSNPPYIALSGKEQVMPEVLAYEPHSALFSENEGYAHMTALIGQAAGILRQGGLVIIEHGYDQSEGALSILRQTGFGDIADLRDLAGLPRCALARKL